MARQWLGLFVVVTVLGSAGCAHYPKSAGQPIFVSGPAGESVVVKATGHYPFSRDAYLRRYSLENGALLASVQLARDGRYDKLTCEPALPGRLWCLEKSSDTFRYFDPDQGLHVRDVESLQIIRMQGQILGGTPELAGTHRLEIMRVDPRTRGFVFESRDGYAWIVDPTTLAPARFAGKVSSIPRADDHPLDARNCSSSIYHPAMGGYWYSFDNEPRTTLARGAPCANASTLLHPEHTYLHGRFLTSGRAPIVLDNPPRLLVVEEAVDHGPTLWSVFADGTVQWKVTDLPYVADAKVYRDTVVLVTSTVLFAIRTQDGAVVWATRM